MPGQSQVREQVAQGAPPADTEESLCTQARLVASEAKFAAAFAQAPIGITITSLETGKLVEVNDALMGFNGYTREEMIGRSPDELGLWMDPKLRQERFARLAAGEKVPPLEARFRSKNGEEAIATISSALVEIAGKPHVLSAVADITALKRSEEALLASEMRQRFLVELNTATQPLSDPAEIMAVTVRLLGQHFDADRCMYAEVADDEDAFSVMGDYTRGVGSMVGHWRMAAFGEVMHGLLRAGKNWVLVDAASDARVDASALATFRAAEIASGVVVPLHKGSRMVAGLAVQTRTPRAWNEAEVALIEQVAHRAWESIERAHAQRELTESESRHRFLLELSSATQALTDFGEVMAVTTTMLGRRLGADRCLYSELDVDKDSVIVGRHYAREGMVDLEGVHSLSGFGPQVTATLSAGRSMAVADTESEINSEDRPPFRAAQIIAWIGAPLLKQGRLVATLAVHQREPRRWTPREVTLVEQVLAHCWDVIERARAQRALAETETRARIALDATEQGTFSWDLRTGLVLADSRYRKIVGLKMHGPIEAADALSRAHPDDVAAMRGAIDDAVSGVADGRYAMEFRMVPPDGAETWVFGCGQVMFEGPQGEASMIHGTVVDISERKRIEQALREADRRKDEFLATLAHELRNPLAPILNSLHVMRLSKGDDPLHEMMERQVQHMVRLVDDLMEVSRISRGKIELKKERLDLHRLIENVLQAVRPQIDAARHTLTVTLPAGNSARGQAPKPFLLDADAVRVSQVLTNLINNSIKYTPPGGKIWLTALPDEEWLVLSVRDNGAGIPKEMLSSIFDMFTQVNRTLAQAQGGLGIGLSLARNLVELHGGRISAHSDGPDMGSEFIVRLPLAADGLLSSREPATPPATAIRLKRILVVDDNRDAADSLAMLLKFLGAETQVAHDGPAALQLLDSFSPAVMLLDLGMPGMDGFEVAREVRKRCNGGITLIALTGWGQAEDRARTQQAGFDQHLIKPPDISALQALLASLDTTSA
ncbi:MAG TPA: ATP-binding protein [Verrucomicrobiae bacterium]|nr:ATP-binding protein [Verrucomicrobiae bacterium]